MADKHKKAQLVFPHQLFEDTSYLDKAAPVYMVEEFLFFKQYKFHKQKIAFHRATMKFYADYLKRKKFKLFYIDSINELSDIQKLLRNLEKKKFTHLITLDVTDNWLEKRLENSSLQLEILDTPLFINTKEDLKIYFDNKKSYHQTDFYKQQRLSRNILMEGDQPAGGKWTFDSENRKKYPKDKVAPAIHFPNDTLYYPEAVEYTEQHFSEHYGTLSNEQYYPHTFKAAQEWFDQFLEHRFIEFGDYEDSIVENANFLHHSVLSPLLNVGLLTPLEILERAICYGLKNEVPINSVEGFVRQILGCREFVRGIYLYQGSKQRTRNYWNHKNSLAATFYTANTGIRPIDSTIQKVLKTGYTHHIERLMILANFMTLCQINPEEVYQWFMELFIDAYDWVMVPNVYGMSTYHDGGLMSTKPYISGSNYIKKMSDYPEGEWATIWDALFWNFIDHNLSFFKKNPRLKMMVLQLDKMPEKKRVDHLKKAAEYIQSLKK